jgi:hypothetical protein
VRHVFDLPGDFFLPFFRALEEEPGIEPVILTHEPRLWGTRQTPMRASKASAWLP